MTDNLPKKIVFAQKEEVCTPKEIAYVVEGGNDWTKVAKKFLGGLGASFIAIFIPYAVNFLQTEDLSTLPTWFIGLVPVLVGILIAINNAWNHRLKLTRVEK